MVVPDQIISCSEGWQRRLRGICHRIYTRRTRPQSEQCYLGFETSELKPSILDLESYIENSTTGGGKLTNIVFLSWILDGALLIAKFTCAS